MIKLKPRIDFRNVLQAAFACVDPKSTKRHWWLDCLFTLLGSEQVIFIIVLTLTFLTYYYFFSCYPIPLPSLEKSQIKEVSAKTWDRLRSLVKRGDWENF